MVDRIVIYPGQHEDQSPIWGHFDKHADVASGVEPDWMNEGPLVDTKGGYG